LPIAKCRAMRRESHGRSSEQCGRRAVIFCAAAFLQAEYEVQSTNSGLQPSKAPNDCGF
jgi:hypothetical protein